MTDDAKEFKDYYGLFGIGVRSGMWQFLAVKSLVLALCGRYSLDNLVKMRTKMIMRFSEVRFIPIWLAILLGTILLIPLRSTQAATLNVACSTKDLITAIQSANRASGADTLELTPDCVYTLKAVNNSDSTYGPNGLPVITGDLTLNGSHATIARNAGGTIPAFRLMQLSSGVTLTLHDVTMQGGISTGDGGAILNAGGTLILDDVTLVGNHAAAKGGAVANDNFGTLNVKDSVVSANHANYGGGMYSFGPQQIAHTNFLNNTSTYGAGLYVDGGLGTLTDSHLGGNIATGSGGALVVYSPLDYTIERTVFESNQGTGGGAIYNGGSKIVIHDSTFDANIGTYGGAILAAEPLDLVNSTLTGNTASVQGGAIYHSYGDLNIANSTLFDNGSADGGALYNAGNRSNIINSTLTGNTASGAGGGIFNVGDYQGTVALANTIVANNLTGGNCYNSGTLTDNGNNLRWPNTDSSCVGVFGDPLLGALGNNGGLTRTVAPGEGSAATDAGSDSECASGLVDNVDQRGLTRPQGAHCDIGAYEVGPATDLSISANPMPSTVAQNSNVTFAIYIQNHGPSPAQNLVFDTQVPNNATFQSFDGTGWSCTTPSVNSSGGIHCTRSSLEAATGLDLALTVRSAGAVPAGTILSNTATIATDTIDLGPSPNTSNATVCVGVPQKPSLRSPGKGAQVKKKASLDWDAATCGVTYSVVIKQDSKKGSTFQTTSGLTSTQFKSKPLTSGKTYYWRISACDPVGCSASAWRNFTAK